MTTPQKAHQEVLADLMAAIAFDPTMAKLARDGGNQDVILVLAIPPEHPHADVQPFADVIAAHNDKRVLLDPATLTLCRIILDLHRPTAPPVANPDYEPPRKSAGESEGEDTGLTLLPQTVVGRFEGYSAHDRAAAETILVRLTKEMNDQPGLAKSLKALWARTRRLNAAAANA